MKLANLFKGMLLSQGYVATLRTLREVAPEVLPAAASGTDAAAERAAREAIDVQATLPWRLSLAPASPRENPPGGPHATDACGSAVTCDA